MPIPAMIDRPSAVTEWDWFDGGLGDGW